MLVAEMPSINFHHAAKKRLVRTKHMYCAYNVNEVRIDA